MLASWIQQFLTVFTIGLSLAPFWAAFGISGGLNTPNPPLGTPLGPTQPPVQWVPALSGVKCGRGVLLTTHPFYYRGHGRVKLNLYPPSGPHWVCNGITLAFYITWLHSTAQCKWQEISTDILENLSVFPACQEVNKSSAEYVRRMYTFICDLKGNEIIWTASLMQQGNFIDVFLARHVSGTYAHHQEH